MPPRRAVLVSLALLAFLPGQVLLGQPPQPPASVRTDHYGDPLPKDARFRLGTVRLRHAGRVTAVGWMSDGRTLASAGEDWTIRLWNIPSGKQIATWEHARYVVFSPDGRTLAYTGILDNDIHCIDVASRKESRKIPLPNGDSFSVALSRKGKIVATAKWGWDGVHLYAVDTGKKLHALDGKLTSTDLVFSPDDRELIEATMDGFCSWNIRTGAKQFPLGKTCFDMFAFSPDGKMLAGVQNGIPRAVTLRSWPVGEEAHRFETQKGVFESLAFSPDGKFLATSEGGSIRLWDVATGRQLHHCKENWGSSRLAFSPDGTLLASAGQDGAVNVWEVRSGKEPRLLPVTSHQLAFLGLASDGQTLLTRSAEDTLTVWDVREGRRLHTLKDGEDRIERFLFGLDASRKRAMLLQEMEHRRHRPGFPKDRFRYDSYPTFSPENNFLAIGSGQDGRILLLHQTAEGIVDLRLADNTPVKGARKREFNVVLVQLAFSPDGRILAATYNDGRLILWDLRTARPHHILPLPRHGEPYRSLVFSSDGRLLAVSDRHVLFVVETASGQSFWKRPLGEHWIDSVAFAPDDHTLAIGDAGYQAAIHLWDLPTNKEFHTLQGHRDSIGTLVFSPDGSFLLSGSGDKTVLCWDVAAILRRRASGKKLSAAKLTELWTALVSKDAARAQRAVAELIQAPDAALPFLEKSLPPVTPAEMARIHALIADLDHTEFVRRDNATKELEKIGAKAGPALRKALLEKPPLEMRRRMDTLLEAIDARQLSPEELRTIRAVQVLETVGTPAARRILEGVAHGAAEALLTQEARAALQRLERRIAKS
jgi:WD40 repeat protein